MYEACCFSVSWVWRLTLFTGSTANYCATPHSRRPRAPSHSRAAGQGGESAPSGSGVFIDGGIQVAGACFALARGEALAYELQSVSRKQAALALLGHMREHNELIVQEGTLVSRELIRSAILWHELWHEGLEEVCWTCKCPEFCCIVPFTCCQASRQYFGDQNIEGMLTILAPLHKELESGPETMHEANFKQTFGRDLQEAKEWCNKYKRSNKDSDLNHAWELYYHVFRRINKQLPQMTSLELQHISPELLSACNLTVCVPGASSTSGVGCSC